MASGKVARRTAVGDVAELLDSPEIQALIGELDALRWTGRKGYGARALVGACLVKALFALPTWTWVAALIAEHPGLQAALGDCPSVLGDVPLRQQAPREQARAWTSAWTRALPRCVRVPGFWP